MESWPILPEVALAASGADSEAFLRIGCRSYRDAARYLHELPYGRNADRANFRLVLSEGRGTCSTKHALLAALAREQGLAVSLVVGIYDMTEANTPGVGRVLSAHGLDSIPEAHCYLRYDRCRVDVTRAGVAPTAPIDWFHAEWTIEPSQIGAHKIMLHQQYLDSWRRTHPELTMSCAELWSIRETCIRALSAPDPRMDKALLQLRSIVAASEERTAKARRAAESLRAARGYHWVGLYEVTPAEIVAIAWSGVSAPAFPRFPISQGLNGAAVRSKRPVIVQDVTADPRYLTTFGSTRAEAIFPVLSPSTGQVVGTIDAESDRTNSFTAEDELFLTASAAILLPLWLP